MIRIVAGSVTALVGVMIWYLKYQTKRQAEREDSRDVIQAKREEKHDKIQTEDRLFNRNLITTYLKELHQDSVKNSELNRKSITLQRSIAKKTIGALNIICDRLNGDNSKMVMAKGELKIRDNKINE